MDTKITLQQLIYIVAVDERGSFVDAAEECRVSQPALSMQVQKLENTLGVKLFDRSRQPVMPTDIGRRIIAQARMTLREAGRVQEMVDLAQGEMKGEYRLGVVRSIGPWALPPVVRQFCALHEDVMLTVREMTTEEIVDALKKDRIDAAIVQLPAAVETLQERRLYYEPLVALVPRSHQLYAKEAISLADLDRRDLLLPERGDPLRALILDLLNDDASAADTSERRETLRWIGAGPDTLRRLVEHDLGVAVIPRLMADEIRQTASADMLREFVDPVPYRTVGLLNAAAHAKGHITEEFVGMVSAMRAPGGPHGAG